ncbi:VOC family protein [Amycolatopsis mongoliensis]|uniref:VOC family protein n=1 Tax=Amycolatopsis mongoliensis TaxID=715475 RepID=A0A9Y2JVL9_9PSEU|nr:VOC family protein [Amycolatopsis sp. 4-36]WIY04327.1 VOC family protein [Amycolatopsis sp. 4-36]
MPEPFDALRRPSERVDPDPDFAAELRDNLRRVILNGADMTTTEAAPAATAELRSLTPYLAVPDARAALDFYVDVFGATRRGEPILMDDGRIGHAELAIGDAVLMLAEEYPEIGHVAPQSGGASVRVEVPDADASVARAVELGGTLIRAVSDSPYGRGGSFRDPFGQRWLVSQAAPKPQPTPKQGEAMYFTFQVPADEPAKTFYGAVLGWQFSPGSVESAWNIQGHGLQGGLWGGPGRQVGWKLMYAVDDLDAALGRVREQGGQAGEVETHPYGLTADCTDNQGIEFYLWQQPAK